MLVLAFRLGLAGAICVALAGCGGRSGNTEDRASVAPAVEAVQARTGGLPLVERLSGSVVAENQVELYPEVSGRVAEVLVQSGQAVEKGQVLLRLADEQYQESVRQAEAGYRIGQARVRQAKARYAELDAQARRIRSLGSQSLISPLELETSAAQLESAAADVELAEAQLAQDGASLAAQRDQLSKTVLRAPIAGLVGSRNAEVGMQLTSSTHVFTIGNLERVKVVVNLTDTMLAHIRQDQTVHLHVGGSQGIAEARLSRISPFLNDVTRTTQAEIEAGNIGGLLRPGMFIPVDILYGESEQATLIPTSAVFTDPNSGNEGVFVVAEAPTLTPPVIGESTEGAPPLSEPKSVEFRPLSVIARGGMEIATDSVQPNEWVVTIGQELLSIGRTEAKVRALTWEQVLILQGLKPEDLLQDVLRAGKEAGKPTNS
jgi:RND family efflux transporter MFP subunit